ncbi:uncharacterized protein LOC143446296 isoform X2 [Clavelina lepadiformis]|uniref:uncharacterized protein LOC143446296 isoform X2 n=1 Tax=Clavelina lepadiformis TaxID=159417 RepID=UPI0040415652
MFALSDPFQLKRIKKKSPNAVGFHCVIHGVVLASWTLSAAKLMMKDKLAIIIDCLLSC